MRKIAIVAACLMPLVLGGCVTSAINGVGTAAGAVPDITNDLSLACQSAENILGLAAKFNNLTIQKTAASLNTGVTKFCTKAIADAPTIQAGLTVINTTAAVLLGLGVAL